MEKSISFFSININNDKYFKIKDYANLVLLNKNYISNYIFDNFKLDLFYNQLSKYDFINKTKHMRDKIGATTFQQLQIDVYTKYVNQIDTLEFKSKSNSNLSKVIKYLVKFYKDDSFLIYLNNSSNKFHKLILNYILKYPNRVLNLVKKIQLRLLNKFKLIEFKNLTYSDINQLSNGIDMIELSENITLTNAVINLQLPNIGKIVIPTKYSRKYHRNLNQIKYSENKKTKQKRYSYTLKIDEIKKQIRIIFCIDDDKPKEDIDIDIEIDNENIIGIDVNTKNNLFSLSDGNTINYDKWILDKYRNYEKYLGRIQRNKEKRNLDKKYGKKVTKRINKMKRISEYYANLKVNELVTYCINKNIKHIVMEELNIRNSKVKSKKEGINYNNISKILHLNDYKNVVKRIATRNGIMVSWVNPEYTSQICPQCGHISRENRKTQETFCCEKCKYETNADENAAINIKNRIYIPQLRKELMEYKKTENMYKGKKYISKKRYEEIYKNL